MPITIILIPIAMSDNRNECDAVVILGILVVFSLPLTLLVPNFSIWDVIPKVQVTRFHLISQHLTWTNLNAAIVSLLAFFFCVYLEIRKRKLDDMVERVMTVNQATDSIMEMERDRQKDAMWACLELLDASAEHYEHLVLLRDELRKRELVAKQHPPVIELSSADV